jgi:hypothetical protein
MLTPEIPEGFKPHDGGPCPVPLDSRPGVMIRGFSRNHICQQPGGDDEARLFNWEWRGEFFPAHIIAYREEPSDAA